MCRKVLAFFLLFLLLLLILFQGCQNEVDSKNKLPRLIVSIVVDQMRADHLTRYSEVYKYGFTRLAKKGAVFTNAHQDHGYTVTGVGHATISTGCFPSRHGIIGNDWYDRELAEKVYCCEDREAPLLGYSNQKTEDGRSPRNLLTSTLGDWLKEAYPESKVFGVARKDRAAIFSTGPNADGAYWYNDADGNLITSEYYADAYPEWVNAFNQSRVVDQYFETGWHKLLPSEDIYQQFAREDDFAGEGESNTFPHLLNEKSQWPDKAYYGALKETPFCEELMFAFAKEAIRNEKLGADATPDLLFVGCSAADAIGHRYGPFSQEALDYYIRLDQYLGKFFEFLDAEVGSENYIVMLSSDHGVMPLPEELIRQGLPAKRINSKERSARFKKIVKMVAAEFDLDEKLILAKRAGGLYINYPAMEKSGIDPATLEKRIIEKVLELESIQAVYTKDELLNNDKNGQKYFEQYQRSFNPGRSGDLIIQGKEYYLAKTKSGTTHGSPYDYDTHVPLIFLGAGIPSGKINSKARTADIAPTLANLLGISPSNEIDGINLLPR